MGRICLIKEKEGGSAGGEEIKEQGEREFLFFFNIFFLFKEKVTKTVIIQISSLSPMKLIFLS